MTQITNHMPTKELQALDAAHHMHPFTADAELAKKGARIITRGKGVYLTDSEGQQILDGMAGLWCVNLGYGRKDIAEVAARQMEELLLLQHLLPDVACARDRARGRDREAGAGRSEPCVLRGLRLRGERHQYPPRPPLLGREGPAREERHHQPQERLSRLDDGRRLAWRHGRDLGAGRPAHPDIVHIDQPYWYGEGGDMSPEEFGLMRARELEAKIEELGVDNVAAFIGEPIQGAGGVIIPPATYWPEIQRICDKHDILLIADEVITGFGRTGNWFGSQTFGIKPHIMTIAKGLSSGYAPIGGSIVCDEIAATVGRRGRLQPRLHLLRPPGRRRRGARKPARSCEEEKIVDHVRNVAHPYLMKRWKALEDHPLVGEAVARRADGLHRADARQGDPCRLRLARPAPSATAAANAASPTTS